MNWQQKSTTRDRLEEKNVGDLSASCRVSRMQSLENNAHFLGRCVFVNGVRRVPAETEDMLPYSHACSYSSLLTSDLANSQRYSKSTWQTHQLLLLLLSPCTPLTLQPVVPLYEKIPA